jgi:hypothetical protein
MLRSVSLSFILASKRLSTVRSPSRHASGSVQAGDRCIINLATPYRFYKQENFSSSVANE